MRVEGVFKPSLAWASRLRDSIADLRHNVSVEVASSPGREPTSFTRPFLVGRDPELISLTDLADQSVESGAMVAFITGEAGIGKSTLANHFLADQAQNGWGVHTGQCIEYSDRSVPFGPIVGLIRSVLSEASEHAPDLLGRRQADIAALLPEWRTDDVDAASLDGDVDRVIDAITTVLVRAAEQRPLALFVEDIHWADSATRDLIASLIHSLGPARILLLVSERTGAVERQHPLNTWLAEQRRFPNVQTIELGGLTIEALTKQAANILGTEPEDSLVAEVAQRTGGNAYFSSELLLAHQMGGTGLPSTLAAFLTSRIDRLGHDEQQVLKVIAVAGEAVTHQLLAATMPEIDVSPAVRSLFDASIIVVDGARYILTHALMREALLRNVLPFEAEDFHRRIAEAITADPGRGRSPTELAALALHWAEANEPSRSIAASFEAATASAQVAAFDLAADLAIEAMRLWELVHEPEKVTGTSRDAILDDACEWLVASNQSERAANLLAAANETWAQALPAGPRARLLAKLAQIRLLGGNRDAAVALVSEATNLVGDSRSPDSAYVHYRRATLAIFDSDIHAAISAAELAVSIARDTGPEDVVVGALSTKALGLGVTESVEAGVELIREARQRALAGSLVSQAALTYRQEVVIIHFRNGRTPQSLQILREGIRFADQHCGPGIRLKLQYDLALGLVEDGQLRSAGELLAPLLESRTGDLAGFEILTAEALRQLLAGRLDLAAPVLADARQLADKFSPVEKGFQHRLDAEFERRSGRFDNAIRSIDAAIELHLNCDNLTYTRESVLEKCRLLRVMQPTQAERVAAMLPAAEKLIDGLGVDDHATASLSDLMRLELDVAKGVARSNDAGELAARLDGFGAEAKLTALLHAELLASEEPSADDINATLAALRELGQDSGMQPLIDAANRLSQTTSATIDLTESIDLTDGSAPSTETSPADDHGLTPREVEVLGLLARGFTNKEIGTELFVSHRTISTHVSNLLSKLHLKNRSEAAAKYHELGFAASDL